MFDFTPTCQKTSIRGEGKKQEKHAFEINESGKLYSSLCQMARRASAFRALESTELNRLGFKTPLCQLAMYASEFRVHESSESSRSLSDKLVRKKLYNFVCCRLLYTTSGK